MVSFNGPTKIFQVGPIRITNQTKEVASGEAQEVVQAEEEEEEEEDRSGNVEFVEKKVGSLLDFVFKRDFFHYRTV